MKTADKIYVAGHTGLVGSAVVRRLKREGFSNLVIRTRRELDLTDHQAVRDFFDAESPDYVIDCAAKVGGIKANMTLPAQFLYENLQIQNNLIWSAKDSGVKKFLFLGSSCIYPRNSPQPMREEYLMEGKPEPTNEAYAYAKIAGMKLCEYIYEQYSLEFVSCMPTNVYGEGDNFDPESSHVIPALINRFHAAKTQHEPEVIIWGSGNSRREFLYVDDLADAILWLTKFYESKQFVNVGTGHDMSIRELAESIRSVVEYDGNLVFDPTKPDGMPRKLLDVSRMSSAGWQPRIDFETGLRRTYNWYLANVAR